jgi:hypothetical protein
MATVFRRSSEVVVHCLGEEHRREDGELGQAGAAPSREIWNTVSRMFTREPPFN